MIFNPLTPWPFFLFWRHDFWPKLASSILNFCRRKRPFQWCPGQSDRPNGALDMRKNAQKVEWKTQSKISCHYTWLLHAKTRPSPQRFLRSFLTTSKPSKRSITAAKRREKEKKERQKNSKNRKAERRTIGHFIVQKLHVSQNFDFCACPSHNAPKGDAGGKKGKLLSCKHAFFGQDPA